MEIILLAISYRRLQKLQKRYTLKESLLWGTQRSLNQVTLKTNQLTIPLFIANKLNLTTFVNEKNTLKLNTVYIILTYTSYYY